MPMLELTVPEGALSEESKRELPGEMAAALLRWEGAPDTEFFRGISWGHLNELPAEAMHTADGPGQDPHAVVNVSVPDGALSDRRKAGLVEELTKLVLDASGWGSDAGLRVWVLLRDVPEGNWAANGQIVHFEQLRQAARAEREKTGAAAPA